ncbi:hypothetical protein A2U01_0001986, partial [Trifolium medium]|nr:hypothetical protein [Trifolium medium]
MRLKWTILAPVMALAMRSCPAEILCSLIVRCSERVANEIRCSLPVFAGANPAANTVH